ncbi:glycosyltransferase family 92 protein [Desulfovibrio sp. OttesenSCG-928-C06]|nr:glycosyltransferase family 92 protein [Desulfovibrio sp. OttesenSCG-928-C06]
MHYLALCCIAKDEDPFIKEWLTYHALLGVERFYIYDNCSRTPIRQLLGPWADDGRITIRRVPGGAMQIPAYLDCLKSFGPECAWIGFIDLDEFVLPMQDNDLRVFLSEFEDYGGVAATWHLFNSSGHLKRPEGPVIRNYTEAFREQESYTIKSFVRPARTALPQSPHHFSYQPGFFCVNEEHCPVSPGVQFSFATGKRIRVNHYFMKSQQDFEARLERGRATTTDQSKLYQMVMFMQGIEKPYVRDTAIHKFLPALENALRKDLLPMPSPRLPAGTDFENLMETAMAFHNAGQTEKALACLCTPDAEHCQKADLWLLRGLLSRLQGNYERAEVFIRKSISLEPVNAAYQELATLMQHKGRDDLAAALHTVMTRYAGALS